MNEVYGLRLLITIVGLEYTLHFFYYYSISIHGNYLILSQILLDQSQIWLCEW